jgi:hypothetical protein
MSIPNFKNQNDYQEFLNIFDDQWQCKLALLNRVKDDLFPDPEYSWDYLQPKTLEVINDMVQYILYDVNRQFKETHQDYKTEEDDIFIPYRSFKENVTEELKEALESQNDVLLCSEDAQKYYDE